MDVIHKVLSRLENINRMEFFVLFIGLLQICALGFMVVESYSLLDKAAFMVNRLEALDMQLDTIEKKIDNAYTQHQCKDHKQCKKI